MRKAAFFVVGTAMTLGVAYTMILAHRGRVAPWDFEDGANPNPGAPAGSPLVAAPKGMVEGKGLQGTTANGYTVRLISLARKTFSIPNDQLPDSRPIWSPDGAPYTVQPFFTNMMDSPATSLEDRGARYLTFGITPPPGTPKATQIEVMGYVSDKAHEETPKPDLHGWDRPRWNQMNRMGDEWLYQNAVVVDDRSATHYRFAIAEGDWKTVATGMVDNSRRASETLLTGPWGKLVRTVIPRPQWTTRWTMADEWGSYTAVSPTLAPPEQLRVRFVDAAGKEVEPYPTKESRAAGGKVKAVIEGRPWHWVELSGIHYNPDPKLWKGGYWGAEGDKAISQDGNTRLEAVIKPRYFDSPYSHWEPGTVYAPDGKVWRGHPESKLIQPMFSGGTMNDQTLIAAFHLDDGRISAKTPARVTGFVSDSPEPGSTEPMQLSYFTTGFVDFRQPLGQIAFQFPKKAYVQFKVQYGSDEWHKVGEMVPSKFEIPSVPAHEREAYDTGKILKTVLGISVDKGEANLFYPGQSTPSDGKVNWPADEEGRVVIRLKSGRRIPIVSDYGLINSIDFTLTGSADGVYDPAKNNATEKARILLSEVEAFEIETRSFSKPDWVVAKVPK